jgi:antiviral helicase SKI2
LISGQSCGGPGDKSWSQQLSEDAVSQIGDINTELLSEIKKLICIIKNILEKQKTFGIKIDPDKWVGENFNTSLVSLVYRWSLGEDFVDVMAETEVMEGNVVRSIMRLEELCQEISRTAQVIGDTSIVQKMEEVSGVLKRDIVFCGSLYV